MKSEKQILNFGKKIIKEEIIALNKIQKHLGLSFAKAVNIINNTKGNIVFTGVGKSKLILEKTCGTFSSCLLYTSPSPRDLSTSRMPSSA